MKKLFLFIGLLLSFLVVSCSGSDAYQGEWKATNNNKEEFFIAFDRDNFIVTDAQGNTETYEYTQHSYKSHNSVVTYGIRLSKDGRELKVHFPIPKNENIGYIMSAQDQIIFTLSRDEFITPDDINKF